MNAANNLGCFDVVVIGGGPGGSTAATLIAKDGLRVLILEREKFPRYQIGESLLPHTLGICRILGVEEEIEQAGFVKKNGGVWYWGSREENGWGFNFGELPRQPLYGSAYAYQVERMKFDEILLRNAQRCGVEVREQYRVEDLLAEDGRIVGVSCTDPSGIRWTACARFVVDAGGHSSPFYSHVGDRVYAEEFRNMALFGYFRGGKRLPAPQSGSILNVSFDKGWMWYIPLSDTLTSVGAVISVQDAGLLKAGYERAMSGFIDSCPLVKRYLADAVAVTDGVYGRYRVRRDWSYCNTRFWRPGLVLIGDAACFVDPLFSSGVHLSTYSALLAARSINTTLHGELGEDRCLGEFEARYRLEYLAFFEFLTTFYDRNLDKEDYFRRAHEIVGSDETHRQAFVRLVSGLSDQREIVHRARSDKAPVTGTTGKEAPWLGSGILHADVDIASMVTSHNDESQGALQGTQLRPSASGLRWREG